MNCAESGLVNLYIERIAIEPIEIILIANQLAIDELSRLPNYADESNEQGIKRRTARTCPP